MKNIGTFLKPLHVALLISLSALAQQVLARDDWMADIDDNTLMSELSIPGTHQSATDNFTRNSYRRCQDWTIKKQLENGIRFLDVEVGCRGATELKIAHGPNMSAVSHHADFQPQVLDPIRTFLNSYPTEFVMLRLRYHKNDDGISNNCSTQGDDKYTRINTFLTNYQNNGGTLHIDSPIATANLGSLRGKLAVMTFTNVNLDSVQDAAGRYGNLVYGNYCDGCGKRKSVFEHAKKNIDSVIQSTYNRKLHLVDTSGSFPRHTPRRVASYVNPRIKGHIKRKDNDVRLGIVAVDFIDDEQGLIDEIIERNPD